MERTENEAQHYQTFEDLEVYQVARGFRKIDVPSGGAAATGRKICISESDSTRGGFGNE